MLLQTTYPSQKEVQRSSSTFTVARVMLVIAAVWCICWFVHAWHYWEDDAYIHLEFARSVAEGHGYSFNGHLVNGDTSPLWVLLLVGVHAVIPDWLVAGKILTALGLVFALTGAYFFSKRLTQGTQNSETFAAAMVLLLVVNPYFCYWVFSGMEALTAAGVAFWAIYAATTERVTRANFLTACFFVGLAPVLRPEMVFFTALASLLLLRQWLRLESRAATKLLIFFIGALLVVVPLLMWSTYALHAFGRVIPNTNAAKRANPGDSVVKRLLSVYSLGYPLIVLEIAALVVFTALKPAEIRKAIKESGVFTILPVGGWLFVIWTLITSVFYVTDHAYVQTRYIFVSAPGLLIAILALNYRALPAWAYKAALVGSLAAALIVSSLTVWPFIHNKSVEDQVTAQMSAFIQSHLPPDAPVALYAIGEVAFDSRHPVIDTGGITRPGAIPHLGHPFIEMVRWAESEGAKYYYSHDQPEPGSVVVFSAQVPDYGWSLNPRHYDRKDMVRLWKLPDHPELKTSSLQ